MKTIVQKLGLWGKRFLLATSLAFAGVVTANAVTITFKTINYDVFRDGAYMKIFQGNASDLQCENCGTLMSYQGKDGDYYVYTYTADNIDSRVGFSRYSNQGPGQYYWSWKWMPSDRGTSTTYIATANGAGYWDCGPSCCHVAGTGTQSKNIKNPARYDAYPSAYQDQFIYNNISVATGQYLVVYVPSNQNINFDAIKIGNTEYAPNTCITYSNIKWKENTVAGFDSDGSKYIIFKHVGTNASTIQPKWRVYIDNAAITFLVVNDICAWLANPGPDLPVSGPSAPTGLAASAASDTQINLTWNAVGGATKYTLQYSTNQSDWTTVDNIGTNSYSHTGRSANTTYYYKVSVTTASGPSEYSSTVNATTMRSITKLAGPFFISDGGDGASTYPTALENYYAYANNHEVSMSSQASTSTLPDTYKWDLYTIDGTPEGNGTDGANHFVIKNVGTGEFMAASTTENAPFTLVATRSDLTTLSLWDYKGSGNKKYATNAAAAAGLYNANIQNLVGTEHKGMNKNSALVKKGASDFTGHFKFTPVSNAPAAPTGLTATANSASQITLNWTALDGATGYKVYRSTTENGEYTQIATPNTNSYSDTERSANTTYYYKVKATNANGDSDFSSAASAATCPTAPTGLTVTPVSDTSMQVSWTAPSGNGAPQYNVYAKNAEFNAYDAEGVVKKATGATSPATITNLVSATHYWFAVTAANTGCSEVMSGVADNYTKPTAPTGLSATANSASQITLTWTAVDRAGIYLVYRATAENGVYTLVSPDINDQNHITTNLFVNTGLSGSTTYYYKVTAVAAGSDVQSAMSSAASATTQCNDKPTGLTVTGATHNSVTLSWTEVAGATGYKVYDDEDTEVASVSTNAATIGNLDAYTRYTYYVKANSCTTSASDEITARTQPAPLASFVVGAAEYYRSTVDVDYDYNAATDMPKTGAHINAETSAVGYIGNNGYDTKVGQIPSAYTGTVKALTTANYNNVGGIGKVNNNERYAVYRINPAVTGKYKVTLLYSFTAVSANLYTNTCGAAKSSATLLTATPLSAAQCPPPTGEDSWKYYCDYYTVVDLTAGPQDFIVEWVGTSFNIWTIVFEPVPDAPEITSVTKAGTGLKIDWSSVTDAEKYEIYRKEGSGEYGATPHKVIDAVLTSFTDLNLVSGTQYCYKMKAVGNSVESIIVPGMSWVDRLTEKDEKGNDKYYFTPDVMQPDGLKNAGNTGGNNHWAKYTVNAPLAGTYEVTVYMARDQGSLTAYLNDEPNTDTPLASFVNVPTNSNWQVYNGYVASIDLAAGDNDIYFVDGTGLNLWKMVFTLGGTVSEFSTEQCATTTVLPANVTLTPQSVSSIQVAWDAVADATAYKVYRNTHALDGDGNSNYTLVTPDNHTATSFTDTGLTTGTTYYYTVSAVIGGKETYRTLPKNMAPTEAVPVLSAARGATNVTLSWTYSGTDSPTFRVLRSSTENGTYTELATGQTSPYTDSGAAASGYYYKVQAERTTVIGGMDWIDRINGNVDIRTDGAFRCNNKQADNLHNAGYINENDWAKYTVYATYAGTYEITAYLAAPDKTAMNAYLNDTPDKTTPLTTFHKDAASNNWQTYDAIDGTVTLSAGANNIYFVAGRGLNFWKMELANNAAPSAAVQAFLPAPENVTATPNHGTYTQVNLTWDAVDGATKYIVYGDAEKTQVINGNVTGTSITIKNLTASTAYTFYVSAADAQGESDIAASNEVTTCSTDKPTAPAAVTVTPVDATHVDVSWTASDANGNTNLEYYVYAKSSEITDSERGTNKKTHAGGSQYERLTDTSARITLNTPNQHYWFAVTANTDCWESALSNIVDTYTMLSGTPVLSITDQTDSELTLSWTSVANATAYEVWKLSDTGVSQKVGDNTSATTIALSNTAIPLRHNYRYYVVAINENTRSLPSNMVRPVPAPTSGCDLNIDPTSYYRSSYNSDYQSNTYGNELDKSVEHMKQQNKGGNYSGSAYGSLVAHELGYTGAGRWAAYRINVQTAGTYQLTMVAAMGNQGADKKLKMNFYKNSISNENSIGEIDQTGIAGSDYSYFVDYTTSVTLAQGPQDLIMELGSGTDPFNVALLVLRPANLSALDLTATAANDIQVNLNWNDLGSGVTYTLERSNDLDPQDDVPDSYAVEWTGTTNFYYDNAGPVRHHHYYYRLSATNDQCATAPAETVDVTTPDQKVRIIGVNQETENNETFLSITWSYAVDDNEQRPTAYKVYRVSSDSVGTRDFYYIGQQDGSQQFYHDKSVGDSESYCYKVSAYYENVTFTFFSGNTKNVSDNGTTTSASTDAEKWSKIPAGTKDGLALYYLKNKSSDKYLCITGDRLGNNGQWYYYKTTTTAVNGETDQYKWIIIDNPGRAGYQLVISNYNYEGGATPTASSLNGHAYILTDFNQDNDNAGIYADSPAPALNCGLTTDVANNVWHTLTEGSASREIGLSDYDCGIFHDAHLDFGPNTDIIETYPGDEFTAAFTVENNGSANYNGDFDVLINFQKEGTAATVTGGLNSMKSTTVSADFTAPATAGNYTVQAQLPNGETTTRTVHVLDCYPATAISLSPASATIYTGDVRNTVTLTAAVTPEDYCGDIVWTSSDETVATVSNGVVTAVAVGSATITASINGHSDTCAITVSAPVAAASVELNTYCTAADLGGTQQLTATVLASDGSTPATDQRVTWTSSDPTIATVSNTGLVTAVKSGQVYITATSVDGEYTAFAVFTSKIVKPTFTMASNYNSVTLSWTRNDGEVSYWIMARNSNNEDIYFGGMNATGSVGDVQTYTVKTMNRPQGQDSYTDLQPETTYKFQLRAFNDSWKKSDKDTPVGCGNHDALSDWYNFATTAAPTALSVNPTVYNLLVGEQAQIGYTVTPEQLADGFTSANTNIATVDALGKITAVAVGTTTITVTADELTKTVTVNVQLNQPEFTNVVPDMQSAELTWDKQGAEYVEIYLSEDDCTSPETLVYSGTGTSTTLTGLDVDTRYCVKIRGCSDENCTISSKNYGTASFRTLPAPAMKIRESVYVLVRGTHDVPEITYTPAGATVENLQWTGGDTDIATINGTTITGEAVGETVFTATATVNGWPASAQLTVYVIPADRVLCPTTGSYTIKTVSDSQIDMTSSTIDDVWSNANQGIALNNTAFEFESNGDYAKPNFEWRMLASDDYIYFMAEVTEPYALRKCGTLDNFGSQIELYLDRGTWNETSQRRYGPRDVDRRADNDAAPAQLWYNDDTKTYRVKAKIAKSELTITDNTIKMNIGVVTRRSGGSEGGGKVVYSLTGNNPWGSPSHSIVANICANDVIDEIVDVDSFAVAPHYAEIYMGQAFQDTLKFTPNNATIQEVDWTVKGSSVEVSADGTITGVDMGTSTVYATTKDGRFVDSTVVRVLPSCDPMMVYAPVAPTMDGTLEDIWANVQPKAIMKPAQLERASSVPTNIPAGFWRLMYDEDNMYVFVQVSKDPNTLSAEDSYFWYRDAIEFYLYTAAEKPETESPLNATNGFNESYRPNKLQLGIDCENHIEKSDRSSNDFDKSNCVHAVQKTPTGFNAEFSIPWSAFSNKPVEQGYIFMEMSIDQTRNGTRDAQITTYNTSKYLYLDPYFYTKVNFFKLKVPEKYVVNGNEPTTIKPDVKGVESFRWVELDGEGNEVRTLSDKQEIVINTDKNMKVRLYVTQKGSCFATYQDIDIKLSNVHLLSTATGTSAVSTSQNYNISSGKGNKMSSVNCNGQQGKIHGDYAMLYLVPANTDLRSSLGVQYEGNGVTLASINGAEYTPDDGNSHWVRYLYTYTGGTLDTLNIGVFPVNANVKLYNNIGLVEVPATRDGYIYTWTITKDDIGTGVFPSLDGTSSVWGGTKGIGPDYDDGLKYKVTYNLLSNCLEVEEIITYGLTIGEGTEQGAAVAFNEDPDLEDNGNFVINVPCVQTMAVLCYKVDDSDSDLNDWKNLDYYTIDLSAYAGHRVSIPFTYMTRDEWGITPVSDVFGAITDLGFNRIQISGVPDTTMTTLGNVCPFVDSLTIDEGRDSEVKVPGVSSNAVYYWMKRVGNSGEYVITYIPESGDSLCFTPDAGYNAPLSTYYYLQVQDGYCVTRSNDMKVDLSFTPDEHPDIAVNNLSVDLSTNSIVANVQNYGPETIEKAKYTLKYTILNISDETSKTITAALADKQDMQPNGKVGDNWTWTATGKFNFQADKAYRVTATIAFTTASKLVDQVPQNNERTIDVCTFVPGDTVYYTIKNTLVNNVDSLCTLHFKTIGGALKHLKSPEGYLSQSGTTRTLTKPVVFNVYYTGKPYREGTDEVTLFGGLSDNLKSTQAFLFENINSGANAENAFIIRAAEHGLRPEVSHFIVRKSRNVIIENLEIEGSVSGDNALDIDDGKLMYFGSAKAGEFDDANVVVRDCKITANDTATVAVVVSGVGDVILNNNVISNPGSNAAVDGASLKLVNAANIYMLRNNIYGATKNVVWMQNSEAVNFAHNVIWNRGVADGSLVALFNRADGQNSVGGKLSLYYNTLVVNNSSEVNTKFLDIANAEGKGMAMGSVNGHLLRLWYNNMYSVGSLTENKWYTKDDNWKIINSDITKNNIYPGEAITPATEAGVAGLGGVADNYMSENVIELFDCGPMDEIDFPLSNCVEDALNVGEPLTTSSDVLLQAADDRLQVGGRSGKSKWTLGAHQANKDAVAVHSIIWTNYKGDNNWDTYANWIVEETMQQLNCTNTFASDLKAIIPSIAGSKFMSESVTEGANGNGYYPTLNALPSKVRIDENKIADVVEIEYGGALPISKFLKADINSAEHSPRYRVFKTSLVMKGEDRQNEDWILVGPNIRPEHRDTLNGRQMISGDYYKDLLPQVFMHEVVLDTNEGTATWKDPFRDLEVAVTQDKGFAIKAPDRYSKWGYPATTYYKSQLSRWEAGSEDLEWTFTGTLEQDVHAPKFEAVGSQWTLMTNTFMGNIDVASLIGTHGGQVAVWSFNDDSKEIRKEENYDRAKTYGSFATTTTGKIKPQHVFFYYHEGDTKNVTLTESVCDFKTPTTYKEFTQGVAPSYKPTLEIRSLNGRYSSVTSIVYDAYLEEEQLGSKEFNLMKLFTGYAQTPDICSYYGADALYSQTINPSIKEVPLGVKAGEELKAVFEFSGAEDFKEVYLEDRLFGKRYDLKNTESLEFDLTEGYNQGRFYVIFEFDELDEPTTDLNESAASEIRIYTEDNENVVVSSEGADLVRIQMIDMSGKQQNIKVKSDRYNLINMSSYPAGVYTFKASTTDRTKVEKVVIK